MSWSSSTRRDRLPPDWDSIRRRVLQAAHYMCQWELEDGTLCLDSANQVDHIIPGDDHRPSNLQALCHTHHERKSAIEGAQARHAARREIKKKYRRTESHPGLL